jgi:hypothetical protein
MPPSRTPTPLFVVCDNHSISVANAWHNSELETRFYRSLDQEGMFQWRGLLDLVNNVELCPGRDNTSWHLESSSRFSLKSMYSNLSQGAKVAQFEDMWETKVPLKIKIFSWHLALDKFH